MESLGNTTALNASTVNRSTVDRSTVDRPKASWELMQICIGGEKCVASFEAVEENQEAFQTLLKKVAAYFLENGIKTKFVFMQVALKKIERFDFELEAEGADQLPKKRPRVSLKVCCLSGTQLPVGYDKAIRALIDPTFDRPKCYVSHRDRIDEMFMDAVDHR
ncbi:MAG: hypothetical protein SP4CHLAM5_06600 [Chlamydiia bacterium]|nr:hypothetical protein [Chlamydiia bacterium]MCH9618528.1 hypothetical protein [Chlamydiia bacterium]MCH9624814.1 hypothetical protein [Chlamydiia bacterium]